jgi:2-haloacid dehalogenase
MWKARNADIPGQHKEFSSSELAMGAVFDPAKARLLSFTVLGTLINVRSGAYAAFEAILERAGAIGVDAHDFWEAWEDRNVEQYWEPWRPYKDICRDSLAFAFNKFDIKGNPALIEHYFDAFAGFELYPDVSPTLALLANRFELALVSDVDADLLALTPLARTFKHVFTADRAKGYKPNGALFRYVVANAGVSARQILHSGQSQYTDILGAGPLGVAVAWINRRGVPLNYKLPLPDYTFPDIASVGRLMLAGKAKLD